MGDSMIAGFWNDAHLFPPPKDGSSYLLMARIGEERPWPVVGHWDSVDEWRSSTGAAWIYGRSSGVPLLSGNTEIEAAYSRKRTRSSPC